MIRPILFIFFLASSCAYIDYKRVPGITKDLIFGKDDIIISQELFEKAEYSFVKVRFGLSTMFIIWFLDLGFKNCLITLNGTPAKNIDSTNAPA